MTEALVYALTISGTAFMALAAIGITRMPDVYLRLAAVTKASTLGGVLLLMAVVLHDLSWGMVVKAALLMIFGTLTAPVSAHVLGRAAYGSGTALWEGSRYDDLKDHIDATAPPAIGLDEAGKQAGEDGGK